MSILARVRHPPNITDFTSREVHPAEQHLSVDLNGFIQTSPETSGFDPSEDVFKVATYVWDTDTLTWVRATQGSGGGSAVYSAPKKKLFEQATDTILYVGEADAGTDTSAPLWRIKKITFDVAGNPISIEYASIGASTNVWNNRNVLSYS